MKNQKVCESKWPTWQVVEFKKEDAKKTTTPPPLLPQSTPRATRNPTRDETLSLERKDVQEHSCVPFNLENVLEDPERNQKPTMVHPENSRDLMKECYIFSVL